MERAGKGVVEAIFEEWPDLAKRGRTWYHPLRHQPKAVVLCGPGNNGGDGFVVARMLRKRGWKVVVLHLFPENKRHPPPDAYKNANAWLRLGKMYPFDDNDARHPLLSNPHPDLWIDAVFGIGQSRPLPALVTKMMHRVYYEQNWCTAPVVAIDFPTGVASDTGRTLQDFLLKIDLTVTFHGRKVGHMTAEGATRCGKVVVKSIGLEGSPRPPGGGEAPARGGGRGLPVVPPGETVTLVGAPTTLAKAPFSHKYTHGHALLLAGPPGYGGAARLAARGALRIGAGLVTVGCPDGALAENAARLDAIMCRPIADPTALAQTLEDTRLNALCLGPGLGPSETTRTLTATALAARRATVLDADALTAFEDDPAALFALLHEACVLTPHGGEFRRLFPDIHDRLTAPATQGPAYSKVDATREAAARAGCTILFKGPDTVVADPDGRCSLNSSHYDRAAPWLATAGSGDVLAGFITGLLARGFAPHDAAATAAWLHTECALSFGPGLIAEDLPEELPRVFRALGL
ncbi:MAG: NAD(P)H-hydrate dehydratase [Pseudomonadota bacterium]